MNKRELRKHFDPNIKLDPNNGILHASKYLYVVRTSVKNIGGRRTLLLYFYLSKQVSNGISVPEYTVFQTRKEYLTLKRTPDGKLRWLTSMTINISGQYPFSLIGSSAFYTKRDSVRVCDFCKEKNADDGFFALQQFQQNIWNVNYRKKLRAKECKIRERMKPVDKIPAVIRKWTENQVIPVHMFYDYRKRKTQLGYCTHCKRYMEVVGAKHKKEGVCPGCGRHVIFHARGRTSHVSDRVTVQMLKKINGELLLRIFKVWVDYPDYLNPKITFWESSRIFIATDGEKIDSYYHGVSDMNITDWKKGYRPVFQHWSYNFLADNCGYLYADNLDKVLLDTPWQYSQLKDFCSYDFEPLEVVTYLRQYLRYPAIEYLLKLRLYRITEDVIYGYGIRVLHDGHSFSEITGISKEYLPLMQKINMGTSQLQMMRELWENNIPPNEELMLWCQQNYIANTEDLIICLRYCTAHRLVRYMNEQYDKMNYDPNRNGYRQSYSHKTVLSLYKDYILFCVDLDYDLSDDFILYPRNLSEAHDLAANMFDTNKVQICNKTIVSDYTELVSKFGMKKFGLVMVPPKSAEQIVAEGQSLHHCVGAYIQRVIRKKCIILFLRKTSEPDTPFYTLELINGKISQIHGDHNCGPTPLVKKYLKVWKEKMLLPQKAKAA